MITRGRCPFCRRVVEIDDNAQTSTHEAPTCPEWLQLMESMGAELDGQVGPLGEQPS